MVVIYHRWYWSNTRKFNSHMLRRTQARTHVLKKVLLSWLSEYFFRSGFTLQDLIKASSVAVLTWWCRHKYHLVVSHIQSACCGNNCDPGLLHFSSTCQRHADLMMCVQFIHALSLQFGLLLGTSAKESSSDSCCFSSSRHDSNQHNCFRAVYSKHKSFACLSVA